jgi:predicted dehydrogenase
VLGAAVAAPYVVTASALGKGGFASPSERITMGFIGVGGQGGGHLLGGAWTYLTGGYVARKDVQVLGVCDVARDRREGATKRVNDYYTQTMGAGKYTACQAYLDFRELLARPDVDAVLIGTPIHWHATMTVLAAKAGKDIYCEKPTSLSLSESRAMADAVLRYGRVFQAGTQQRSEYGGKFRLAIELARSGRIGKLQSVYSCINGGNFVWQKGFGQGKPVPESLDWDLWLGPAPWMPFPGQANAHQFGDGGTNWGQHHFDIVQGALDGDRTGPVEIGREDGKQAIKYANGVTVYTCFYPGEKIGSTGGCTMVGTEGRISVDREHLVTYPASILEKPLGPDEVHLYENSGHSDNFLDCVRTRKQTTCDVQTAHHSASLMILAGLGEKLGRPLKWDPVKEEFLNDDEANRMRSVAKRPPWQI